MNDATLKKYYVWMLKALVFVIPFLSLWIAQTMFFPYITARNFAFRIIIEIALALWIGLAVLDKRYRPKPTFLFWALTIFVAIVGIANLLGVDPHTSFWSRFERMEGYLMILHLYAYFLIITSIFRSKKEWLTFFNIFLIVGLLVGGYAWLQVFGVKESIQGGGVRVDGTIGNPTYLAVYLIFIITLSLISLFNATQKLWKLFYIGILIYSFLILYFTASRGVALAFFITVPVFLLLYAILIKPETPRDQLYRKLAISGLAAIILAPILFLSFKNSKFVQESNVLSRFASLSLTDSTVKARLLIWGVSWRGFQERPILGWGQENYLRVFAKHFDPKLYDQEPWFDRPHNIIFEWLLNAGVLGLISYLSLFVVYFMNVRRAWRLKKVGVKEGLILVLGPIAYFVQNLLVFDNFNTYALFFALLGYVNMFDEKMEEKEVKSLNHASGNKNISLGISAVGLVVAGVIIYFVNVIPTKTARGIITSLQATTDSIDPFNKTLQSFQKTLDYKTFGEGETLEQLTRVATSLMGQEVDPATKVQFLDFAAGRLEDYLKRNPENIRIHLFTGSLYNSAARIETNNILKAREHFTKALALSPKKQQVYYSLADNYLRTSEFSKTMDLLQKAVDLEPSNPEAYTNKAVVAILIGRHDIVGQILADLYKVKQTAALKNPERSGLALGFLVQSLDKIANTYVLIGDKERATVIYKEIINLLPDTTYFREVLNSL
ncbi:MAG: O-antigen ligase family protein [Patescibacteria group bacterium]